MKTRAAVPYGQHQPCQIEGIDLDEPKGGAVLVRIVTSWLCHSDEDIITGGLPVNVGNSNPRANLLRYLDLYRTGTLKVDGRITRTDTVDRITEGYQDMLKGRTIRGVIVY